MRNREGAHALRRGRPGRSPDLRVVRPILLAAVGTAEPSGLRPHLKLNVLFYTSTFTAH